MKYWFKNVADNIYIYPKSAPRNLILQTRTSDCNSANLFEQYQKDEFINYELIEAIGYIGIMRQLDDDIIEKRMKEILQNLEKKGYAKYRIYDYLFYITKNEKYLDAILNGLQSWDDDIRYQALYTVEDVIINEDDNKWLKKINKKLIDNIEKDKRYNRIYRERLINRIRERMGKKKTIICQKEKNYIKDYY